MKCEEKVPNGKLVCLELWAERGRIVRASITGDFFLHPEERIGELEASLAGLPTGATEAEAAERIRKALGDGTMIGLSPEDLGRMFRKAVG